MSKKFSKKIASSDRRREKRKTKIRSNLAGTTERPRLCVFRSNTAIYAQIIDDVKGITLACSASNSKDLKGKVKHTKDGAKTVGETIAKLAIQKKIKKVVFDRGGYLYHGKIKALADGARAGGLEF
jgi:large subunit ribosomal protein L18